MLHATIASVGLNPELFELWPDICGDIHFTRPAPDHTFYWAVPAGRCYVPGVHPRTYAFAIKAGSGVIRHNGQAYRYHKGDVFHIAAGDICGFVQVHTDTVFYRGPSEPLKERVYH